MPLTVFSQLRVLSIWTVFGHVAQHVTASGEAKETSDLRAGCTLRFVAGPGRRLSSLEGGASLRY